MSLVKADRVKETSTSTGTGNFVLAGASATYRTFEAAFGHADDGTLFPYVIKDGSNVEVGLSHLSDAVTLVRDTVLYSTNANAKVSFTTGAKDVWCDLPSARVLMLDENGDLDFTATDGAQLQLIDSATLRGTAGAYLDGQAGVAAIGDTQGVFNGTRVTVDDGGQVIDISSGGEIDLNAPQIFVNGLPLPSGPYSVEDKSTNFSVGTNDLGKVFHLTVNTKIATLDAALPVGFHFKIASDVGVFYEVFTHSGSGEAFGINGTSGPGETTAAISSQMDAMVTEFIKVSSTLWLYDGDPRNWGE